MRLIDADALLKQFSDCNFKGYVLENLIKEQTTVDAVPVVRCEECRYSHWLSGAKKYACRHPLYTGGNKHRGDHFCSYGERRNDDA